MTTPEDDETLADWIGEDAANRFATLPDRDAPALLDWATEVCNLDSRQLAEEIRSTLLGVALGDLNPVRHDEFRDSVLRHEASRRRLAAGHQADCPADTLYEAVYRRLKKRGTVQRLCGCLVEDPPDYPWDEEFEAAVEIFTSNGWTTQIHPIHLGAWLHARRRGASSSNLYLFRYRGRHSTYGNLLIAYEPEGERWYALNPNQYPELACAVESTYVSKIRRLPGAVLSPRPDLRPYKMSAPTRGGGKGEHIKLRVAPEPLSKSIPVPTGALFLEEMRTLAALTKMTDEEYSQTVLELLSEPSPDARVHLSHPLVARTLATLLALPGVSGYREHPLAHRIEQRRFMILDHADARREHLPSPARHFLPEVIEKLDPPIHPPEPSKPLTPPKPPTVAVELLTQLHAQEFSELLRDLPEGAALRKLRNNHYKDFNHIRFGLENGRPAEQLIQELTDPGHE